MFDCANVEMRELLPELAAGTLDASARARGIGLAVVERIVAEHGGHVALASEEGLGTTLTFSLPIMRGA